VKALIVEDDFISRHILKEFLSLYGKTDIAVDGEEAVDSFRLAWEENDPYDLICMDIMMPKVDGQEALRRIRELEMILGINNPQRVKVIMVTSVDDLGNMNKAVTEGGANFYMVKPINKQKLARFLNLFKFSAITTQIV
jgi:two-component system, chemotaxis family, chemotaxis protein CheY